MSPGQLEAARTLGLSERQILTLIRGPQALRLALAPMTNDFIALLKDSSLVSVLTVMELTKQTQIFATNLGSWVIPGVAVRGALPGDVAAAGRAGAAPRTPVEGARRHDDAGPRASRRASPPRARGRSCAARASTVGQGELVAIMGPSGSGKTTILRAIAGLDAFQAGQVAVDDVSLAAGDRPHGGRTALRQLRRKVGLVFQFHCLFEHLSALDNVCLAPVHAHGVSRDAASRRAHELLHALGVEHRAAALPRELSGGEAQRVAIARALAVDPQVLLMDEPTASLDPAAPRGAGRPAARPRRAGPDAAGRRRTTKTSPRCSPRACCGLPTDGSRNVARGSQTRVRGL